MDGHLEQRKEHIKADLRKELKIKEGADNLLKVAKDAKQKKAVQSILKACQGKLQRLQEEMDRLNAEVVDGYGAAGKCAFQ